MAQNTPDPIKTQAESTEPIIPPGYLLGLAAIGFVVAAFVLLTQPEFNVVGIGGLAFGILALILWAILAPDKARGVLTGRTARFGGMSILVTLLLIAALVVVYVVVRQAQLRIDLTESDTFSLTDESRQAIAAIGADPSLPPVLITAFYSQAQMGAVDMDEPLFKDYRDTSGGKIDYRFIDPDRNPALVDLYGVTNNGQIVVTINNEAGEPDIANAERISFLNQEQLTNAILKVSAQGEFRAFFLNVEDGVADRMTSFKSVLTDVADWNVQDIALAQLTSPEGEFRLNDPNIDGQVIIIPGGSAALAPEELQILEDYLAAGGDLIIFAALPDDDQESLATDPALSEYLAANFGISFNNDYVFDSVQAFQDPAVPVATDFDLTAYITTGSIDTTRPAAVFQLPNSINIAEQAPSNVTVTPLVRSSGTSYAKSDLTELIATGSSARAESDAAGPFVLMAQAENTATGARVVLIGNDTLADDSLVSINGVYNLPLAFNSAFWTTDFLNYFQSITVLQQQRPQDTPMFASASTIATAQLIAGYILPFGVLLIGVYVWWSGRERARS